MKKFLVVSLFLFGAFLNAGVCAPSGTEPATLPAALKSGLPVILKLGAGWCSPCKRLAPIIKELQSERKGKEVYLDLDVYKNKDLASKYEVKLIPTIVFFDKHGKLKGKTEGFMDKMQLLKAVDELGLRN